MQHKAISLHWEAQTDTSRALRMDVPSGFQPSAVGSMVLLCSFDSLSLQGKDVVTILF